MPGFTKEFQIFSDGFFGLCNLDTRFRFLFHPSVVVGFENWKKENPKADDLDKEHFESELQRMVFGMLAWRFFYDRNRLSSLELSRFQESSGCLYRVHVNDLGDPEIDFKIEVPQWLVDGMGRTYPKCWSFTIYSKSTYTDELKIFEATFIESGWTQVD